MSEGVRISEIVEAIIYLCPRCSSAVIDQEEYSQLVQPSAVNASCKKCDWFGAVDKLVVHRFQHELGSDERLAQAMANDLRNILARDLAMSLSRFLHKWGFITANVTGKELSMYIVAAAQALMRSIIETRQSIAREKL